MSVYCYIVYSYLFVFPQFSLGNPVFLNLLSVIINCDCSALTWW